MRDRATLTMDDLRGHPTNSRVLKRVEGREAHGDLAEVLVRYAAVHRGVQVLYVSDAEYAATVVARPDGQIVAYAESMRELVLRVVAPPDGARLDPECVDGLGPDWWRINPFSAEVTRADTDAELRAWFAALR